MSQTRRRSRLAEVAARAGVSPVTVSRALRHPEMVSLKLRARIEAAVHDLNYVPNRVASALASARTNLVGVIVSSFTNGVFADYLGALHDGFHPAGIQLAVLNSRYSLAEEAKAISLLLGQHPEALIVAGVEHTPQARRLLETSGIPVIQTMELCDNPIDINIGLSQHKAGYAATRYLQDLGHRRIGVLAARMDSRLRNRIAGYQQAMSERNLDTTGMISGVEGPTTTRLGGELLRDLMTRIPDLEAVFCTNDDLALGALFECKRQGIAVPEKVSIMGFNDLEFCASASPSITSVATPRYEMGRKAAEIVLEIVRGGGERPKQRLIDVGFSIQARQSTGPRRPLRKG
jgi:LacI family transcriptional regulator, gluconate utilization system Gnt-I transcriptional repressor